MKISLQNLSFLSKSRNIFSNLNFDFESRQKYFLRGSSGCGKSSLLSFISSIRSASSGKILIDDQELTDFCAHRKKCQLLLQHPVFFEGSIIDNLQLALNNEPPNLELIENLCHELFPEGLDINSRALDLSGGQKHRLSLIRSYLLNPQTLLCDEISAGLDQKTREICENFILNKFKMSTVIFVSHIQESFINRPHVTKLIMTSQNIEAEK